jgi:hypothetical protein
VTEERKVKIVTGNPGRPKGVNIIGSSSRATEVKIVSSSVPRDRSQDERKTEPEYGSEREN